MGEKLAVYDEVVVECSEPWLEAPQALILPHNGRTFEVQVRPRQLHTTLRHKNDVKSGVMSWMHVIGSAVSIATTSVPFY